MSKHKLEVEIPDDQFCYGCDLFDGGDDGFAAQCNNGKLRGSTEIGEGLVERITRSRACIKKYGIKGAGK